MTEITALSLTRLCLERSLAIVVSIVAFAGTASADSFKEHYERALRLADQGKFAQASDEAEAAYHLQPVPNVLASLGLLNLKAKHYAKALSYCQEYLRKEPQAPAPIRARFDDCVTKARAAQRAVKATPAPRGAASATQAPLPLGARRAAAPAPVSVQPATTATPSLAQSPAAAASSSAALPPRPGPEAPARTAELAAQAPAAMPNGAQPAAAPAVMLAAVVPGPAVPTKVPIHRRWWFWTGLGVIAAGSVATGVILGTRASNDPFADIPTNSRVRVEF